MKTLIKEDSLILRDALAKKTQKKYYNVWTYNGRVFAKDSKNGLSIQLSDKYVVNDDDN